MRAALLLAIVMLLPAGFVDAAAGKKTNHPYRKSFKHETVGKGAMGRVAAGAGLNQLRGRPSKYGGGVAGFGKRFGAGFAGNGVNQAVKHGLAAKLHEELHYRRSNKHGVAPRLGYALKSTVITHDTRTGKQTPAAGRIAGHAAAGAFTQGVLAAGSGASTAGIGLAADAGSNVAREFIPPRKKHPHHKK